MKNACRAASSPARFADMVILGENPLEIAPERIRDIPILATLVDNRLVYGSLLNFPVPNAPGKG